MPRESSEFVARRAWLSSKVVVSPAANAIAAFTQAESPPGWMPGLRATPVRQICAQEDLLIVKRYAAGADSEMWIPPRSRRNPAARSSAQTSSIASG
jgi:hypothetical protein